MWIALLALACVPKKLPPPPPPVGWHDVGSGACYAPPAWEKLETSARKMARQASLEAMKAQWSGQKGEDIVFEEAVAENLEMLLLSNPEKIEAVTAANHEACVAYRSGGPRDAWEATFRALPGRITAGECLQPMRATTFDYLVMGKPWQGGVEVCKGNRVSIDASSKDRFRLRDGGPWITVLGESGTAGTAGLPCVASNCPRGLLLGKFVATDGTETLFPIGAGAIFTAPAHGTLSYGLNDDTWADNKYFKKGSIEDSVAITLKPAD
jgi:hypothetical protein